MTKITTSSENTIGVYNFLRDNEGEFTLAQLNEALGTFTAQILGGLSNFVKKGIVGQGTTTLEGKPYKTYFIIDKNVEFTMGKAKGATELSEKAKEVMEIIKSTHENLTAAEIAENMEEETMTIAVNGVVNGLVKRGLVVRVEGKNSEGKPVKRIKLVG